MFDSIGIAVKDSAKSLEFYSLFGLDFKNFDDSHFEAKTTCGIRIMLDTHELLKKINLDWRESINPTTTLGFSQNKPSDVDFLYKKVVQKGYRSIHEPWDAFWGQRYASVLDPDGNQIDIFSDLD